MLDNSDRSAAMALVALLKRKPSLARSKPVDASRLLLERLEPRLVLDVGPLWISEFMAINDSTLADENNDYEDWIEIYNPTGAAVNLDGWSLTDDSGDRTKWPFPDVSLDPGDYLVVFASDKDRTEGAELHTNFKLTGGGEYLALVRDEGATIAHDYDPNFPQQFADISYGLSQASITATLIAEGADARTLIPADGLLGTAWTGSGFNDAGWIPGTTGIGYDTGADYGDLIGQDVEAAMRGINSTCYARIPFEVADPSVFDSLLLRMKYDDGFAAYLNGSEVARRNAPTTPSWNSAATDEHGQPVSSHMSQDFDGGGTAYTPSRYGNLPLPEVYSGGPDGNFLRLIYDNVTSNVNRISFDRVHEGPAPRVAADFDFRFTSGDPNNPADGLAFILLPTSTYGTSGVGSDGTYASEEPNLAGAFAVGFDLYPEPQGVNDVSAHWNGVEIVNARMINSQIDLDAGVFHHAHIELVEAPGGARVTVTLTPDVFGTPGTPVTPINNVLIPGFTPYESRVEFSGRTGGLHVHADLDNIEVEFGAANEEIAYEDVDISGHLGLLQADDNVLAIHGLNVSAGDADFLVLPELLGTEVEAIRPEAEAYFTTPTPGALNQIGSEMPSEAPMFSHPGGTYVSSFSLTLSVEAPDAVIHYSTNGSIPTELSPVYQSPIWINTTTRIRARAVQPGHALGPVVSEGYIFLDSTARNFSSDVPLIVLDTYGMGLGDTYLTPATSVFIETGTDGRADITDPPEFAGRSGLRIRGQTSQGFPKKQYAFETWAEGNADTAPIAAQYSEDLPVSLFGMPAESDWVIQGPYSDKTLMRNYLSYSWSNDIGQYAPRVRFCEVFVNLGGGKIRYPEDYVGAYVFMEKIKGDADRVDVTGLTPQDNELPEVSGGYIWKKDKPGSGDQPWTTSEGQELRHVEPKARDITPQQQAYLEGYINEFESVLYGPNFTDPVNGYAKYIDVDSWIDHWIIVELTKNIDGFRLSTYYHKDREGKIRMGPVWDYNLSLGNADYLEGWLPNGWYGELLGNIEYPYWRRLFEDPNFKQRLVDRWQELRGNELDATKLLADVDQAAATLGEAQARNFQKWNILGVELWPNWYVGQTWQQEVDWMKSWLQQRVAWMDSQFTAGVTFNQEGGQIDPGFMLEMNAPAGGIYYTRDGSDPRAPGGSVSATAEVYRGTSTQDLIEIDAQWAYEQTDTDLGTGWRDRTYNDSSWPRGDALLYYEGSSLPGPKNTLLDLGPTTFYFRTHFSFSGDVEETQLQMMTILDDGAVFYLNDQEAYRLGMGGGAYNHETFTSRVVGNAVYEGPFTLPTDALRQGDNVLAVEVHQASSTSSDVVFGMELDAVTQAGGTPIPLGETTLVKARANAGGQWSGLHKAVFLAHTPADAGNLAITEIHYNPADPTPQELATQPPQDVDFTSDDFEFLEVHNLSDETIDVAGSLLVEGIDFDFAENGTMSLGPHQYAVIVRNLEAFDARYDTAGVLIAGQFEGDKQLSNSGEGIRLQDAFGATLFDFSYNDAGNWPGRADGKGASLELIDPGAVPPTEPERTEYLENGDHWHSSMAYGGTPGAPPQPPLGIVVNEVLTHTDPPLADTIELHNATAAPIDVGGWYLSDSWGWESSDENGNYKKYRIPFGTSIPAGGYLAFDEDDFNPSGGVDPELHPYDFALNGAHGDDVWLMKADAAGKLTHFVDHVEFPAAASGESFGRWPNGTGDLYPMTSPTLDKEHPENGENAGPRVGPVILSELHYNPDLTVEDDDLEFVEIYNSSGEAVDLTGWRIRKGIDYDFPDDTWLEPYAPLVILPFDPGDGDKWSAFCAEYGLDPQETDGFLGGYSARLDDDGEQVQLQRADEEPADEPGFIPRLMEDDVRYDDEDPWPDDADGRGDSLHRAQPDAWAHTYASWGAFPPTPGTTTFVPPVAEVVGRYVFYNNSAFDGNDPGADPRDDAATALDKAALMPGATATFANYTSYSRGINGIIIDVDGLPQGTVLDVDDFRFRVGNNNSPGSWGAAPSPQVIAVRAGEGVDGSDRVTLIWDDNVIQKQWLQVTVYPTPATALAEEDVFYFGNAMGDSGNSATDAKVNAFDMLGARDNQRTFINPAAIDFAYDFNRDARVNTYDMLISRDNQTHFLNALKLVTVPGEKAAGESAQPATPSASSVNPSSRREALSGNLAWWCGFEQTSTNGRPANRHRPVVEAIDALLATFPG